MPDLDPGDTLSSHNEGDSLCIADHFDPNAHASLFRGDCMEFLYELPEESVQLIVTSPPYNVGKRYEGRRKTLDAYLAEQAEVVARCVEVLRLGGSICWQVGMHISNPQEVLPLDIALYPLFASHGLTLRNRIIWHFEHGLHCSKRFSGRHETILWFTKGENYTFNLDAIRVPQKYPGKRHYKGPNKGQYSGNPLGKNPGDVWVIPNVKHNHVEKTVHSAQFPVELVERLILSMTRPGDLVLDPYMGVASTAIAALRQGRRVAGAEVKHEYYEIGLERLKLLQAGLLRLRPMYRPILQPVPGSPLTVRQTPE